MTTAGHGARAGPARLRCFYPEIHDCRAAVGFCSGESRAGEEGSYGDVGAEDLGLEEITALLKAVQLAGGDGVL